MDITTFLLWNYIWYSSEEENKIEITHNKKITTQSKIESHGVSIRKTKPKPMHDKNWLEQQNNRRAKHKKNKEIKTIAGNID